MKNLLIFILVIALLVLGAFFLKEKDKPAAYEPWPETEPATVKPTTPKPNTTTASQTTSPTTPTLKCDKSFVEKEFTDLFIKIKVCNGANPSYQLIDASKSEYGGTKGAGHVFYLYSTEYAFSMSGASKDFRDPAPGDAGPITNKDFIERITEDYKNRGNFVQEYLDSRGQKFTIFRNDKPNGDLEEFSKNEWVLLKTIKNHPLNIEIIRLSTGTSIYTLDQMIEIGNSIMVSN